MDNIADYLDLKDRKILYELEQDSRQSLAQLGKKVGLSKETVFHRIKSLEERKIIKKYLTEINVYKLGYQFYPGLIKYQNTKPEIEEEIYNYLKNNRYVAWLTRCEGAWDINLTLIAKDNSQVNEFFSEFLQKYSDYISDKHLFITTDIYYFKRGFWLNKQTTKIVGSGGEKTFKIDELDFRILRELAIEARKSLVDISSHLKTNPKNVAYRIKKLEKENIIQGYRILVDFKVIGYKFYKVWFSLKNINNQNFNKLIKYLERNPNIIWATKTLGFYDLSIEMEVEDTEAFRKILNEIKEKFSDLIKRHESLLIFEEGVMNYLPQSSIE